MLICTFFDRFKFENKSEVFTFPFLSIYVTMLPTE